MLRLNLLPIERKQAWALTQKFQQWRGTMMVVVFACLISNAALFILSRYQADSVTASSTELQSWQALTAKQESGQVTKTTKQLNTTVTGLQALYTPLSTHAVTVATVIALLPPDIQVTDLTVKPDGAFTLTGTAATRASFLALRTALDGTDVVANIATTSTASLREKLPFEYTGTFVLTQ